MTEETNTPLSITLLSYPYYPSCLLPKYDLDLILKEADPVGDAQRWHANNELNQRINYRHAVEQVQRNYQMDQHLDFMSRPNPFVPQFQNGL